MEQIARTPKQIGEAIRRRRRQLKYHQKALGERTRLRQATVSAVESGEPGTTLRTLLDLMTALDLEFVIRPRTKAPAQEVEDIF